MILMWYHLSMKLINRDTDYAVRALVVIARKKGNERISTLELEDTLSIPRPFLRKILQALQKAGIVDSAQGNQGGFTLARPAEKILLADIMCVFQGDLKMVECLRNKKICPSRQTCPLRAKLKDIESTVVSQLNGITLASLLDGRHKSAALDYID